jgi:nucleoside-diphosphate kinase
MDKEYKSIEKTFLMIKPDGLKRGLVGEVYSRLERIGLKMVACRMIKATKEQARNNYPGTVEWLTTMGGKTYNNYNNDVEAIRKDMGTIDKQEIGQKIYDALVDYLVAAPIILTVWEGNHAVDVVRKLVGRTDPVLADVGSIRGDFGFDTAQFAVTAGRIVFQTIVHCSESSVEAKREIANWFGDNYHDYGNYSRLDYTGMYEINS